MPICVAVIVGGLGLPGARSSCAASGASPRALVDPHPAHRAGAPWSCCVVGIVRVCSPFEWPTRRTLGPLDVGGTSCSARRSAGGRCPAPPGSTASTTAALGPETLAVTDVLMFIGGGSAGTAGGIKVTTFFLLAFVIWAEVRGEHGRHRRRAAASPAQPAPGAHRRAARRRAGRRRHAGPAARHRLRRRPGRCSRRSPRSPPSACPPASPPTCRPTGQLVLVAADVRRPGRPASPWPPRSPCAPAPPLPASRGATHRWLGDQANDATASSSSASAGSAARSPTSLIRARPRGARHRRATPSRAELVRRAHPRRAGRRHRR